MAQKPGMSHDEWLKLQELLGHAQENGLIGEALVAMGLEDGLAQQVGSEIENSQQTVVRPKAKAKQSGIGTRFWLYPGDKRGPGTDIHDGCL